MNDEARPGRVRHRVATRVALALAIVLAAASFAGMLPGSTIFLGMLSSDPPLDVLRAAGAAVLAVAAVRPGEQLLRRSLEAVGVVSLLLAAWTAIDPHSGGALGSGVTPIESPLTAAVGAVALTGARVLAPPTRRA